MNTTHGKPANHQGRQWLGYSTRDGSSSAHRPRAQGQAPPRAEFTRGLGQLDTYMFLRQPSKNAMPTPKFLMSQQGWKPPLQEPQVLLVGGGGVEKTGSRTHLFLHERRARAGQDPLDPPGTV